MLWLQNSISQPLQSTDMCNRYANSATLSDMRNFMRDLGVDLETTSETGNFQTQDIYPDRDAAIIRSIDPRTTELAMARWGFPVVRKGARPITNIRNLNSSWWRNVNGEYLLSAKYRCLVPVTAFAEPPRNPTWFAVPNKPLVFFAGIWRPWTGKRLMQVEGKTRRQQTEGDYELFSFLTTEANEIVKSYHDKAMPVMLTKPEECSGWLAGGEESLRLQRPLPDCMLTIVPNDSVFQNL